MPCDGPMWWCWESSGLLSACSSRWMDLKYLAQGAISNFISLSNRFEEPILVVPPSSVIFVDIVQRDRLYIPNVMKSPNGVTLICVVHTHLPLVVQEKWDPWAKCFLVPVTVLGTQKECQM